MIEPLRKIEKELLSAAPRRTGRGERRAKLALVAVAASLMAAATAAAITGIGTSASPIESPSIESPSPLTPKSGGERTSLKAAEPGGKEWTLRGLRGEEGSLCVEAPPRPAEGAGGICVDYTALANAFAKTGLVVYAGAPDGETAHFVLGLAPADAQAVRVVDQDGRRQAAELSEVWATARPGDGLVPVPAGAPAPETATKDPIRVRAFMLAANGTYPTVGKGIELELTTADGTSLTSAWPSDYDTAQP